MTENKPMKTTKGIIRWVKHIECVAEMSNLYSLFGRHEEKRRGRRRKDAVKVKLKKKDVR
jgi:hypothetical protein